jgi:hypothetical protein
MPSAMRFSLPRGLRAVGLGIAYGFSLLTSSASPNGAAADSPIQIVFRNQAQRTVDRVSFSVDNREGNHQIDDRGDSGKLASTARLAEITARARPPESLRP